MKTNLIDAALQTGLFTTFLALVKAANLISTIKNAGPFTLLAPTDDACHKLSQLTIEKLLMHPQQLEKLISNHLIPGSHSAVQLQELKNPKTVEGHPIRIGTIGESLFIGPAKVIQRDIEAHNGIIHGIDTIIVNVQ